MPNESKKHHFVPRSLLKNFYNDDGKLFVFDKVGNKSFPTTAENAGHENYFNSIDIGGEKFNFEDFFAEIDSNQAHLTDKIASFDDEWELTEAEKWKLAYFTLVQMHRTKLSRTTLVEYSNDVQNWMEETIANTEYNAADIRVDAEQSKLITLQQIQSIPQHIHHLTDRHISIVKASEPHVFYTSDNPVVMYNPYAYLKTGLGGVGTEVCFPISSKLLVNFSCPVTVRKLRVAYNDYAKRGILPKPLERSYRALVMRKIDTLDPEFVNFYNELQTKSSSRFLYASTGDFKVARQILERSPNLKEVKTKMALGSQRMHAMPDGAHVVLSFADGEHTMIAVELMESSIDLKFKVSEQDSWKIAGLYDKKEPIDFVQTFIDKMESRGMRDVEIITYDPVTRVTVISHRDKGFNAVLKHMMEERAKRKK